MDHPTSDWLAGGQQMIRREGAGNRSASWYETFFLYFEETDLCLRAERGWFRHALCAGKRVIAYRLGLVPA